MYSWPGEDRFGDRDLFEIVRDGAISTGSFSAILASIFGDEAIRFSYNGDKAAGGRLLPEFGCESTEEQSQYLYVLRNHLDNGVRIAYNGSVLVNPDTADVVKLVIR